MKPQPLGVDPWCRLLETSPKRKKDFWDRPTQEEDLLAWLRLRSAHR